ncbi:MAG: fused MFS/spermidine synthase [Candidatus Wallbacteria bacterium]|nr:fused MFS/spermidine synthase [Candidatus Wallbacteria bacterium]
MVVVLLSGASFLVYEVSWFRMLSLALGATVTASTIVLSGFMAGLGAGAYWFGSRHSSGARPARTASALLGACGLLGLLSGPAIRLGIPALQSRLVGAGLSEHAASLAVLFASLAGLFLPAFLMGGVLPVMATLLVREDREVASMTGRLYATETFGSALGALASGFVLIRWLGQANTLYLSAAVNFVCAAAMLARELSPGAPPGEAAAPLSEQRPRKPARQPASDAFASLLGVAAFGVAGAGLQVAWFRILRIHLTNTSYSFSLITALSILGIFGGSRFFSGRKRSGTRREMALVLFAAAAATIAGCLLLVRMPELLMIPLAGKQDSPLLRIFVIPAVAALLVILPVTFASGYSFPMACALYAPGHRAIGGSIGRVYAASAAGGAAGPLLAAFFLIPAKGAVLGVLCFAVLLAWAGATLVIQPRLAAASAAVLLAGISLLPGIRVVPPSVARYGREVVKYQETVEGTWLVAGGAGRGAAVSTYVNNSAVIGSSYDAVKAVKLLGHLPFLAGLRARRALIVGFGIGVTASAVAAHPEVERIDCVELVAGLREAAGFYSELNANVHLDRRLRILSGDGRHFLQSTAESYDLISCDPTHPVLGSGSLYTREYFELCRGRLNSRGMVTQYLPLHKLRLDDLLGIIQTFREVFPGATVWLGHSHAVLLGTARKPSIDFAGWSTRISSMPRDPYFYTEPHHLAACFLLDGEAIARFPPEVRINTDDHPLTEFFSLSALDEGNASRNLIWLHDNRVAVNRVFKAFPDPDRMARFSAGNRLLTAGIIRDLAGDRPGFRIKLTEAIAANPENEEYPFLMKYYE